MDFDNQHSHDWHCMLYIHRCKLLWELTYNNGEISKYIGYWAPLWAKAYCYNIDLDIQRNSWTRVQIYSTTIENVYQFNNLTNHQYIIHLSIQPPRQPVGHISSIQPIIIQSFHLFICHHLAIYPAMCHLFSHPSIQSSNHISSSIYHSFHPSFHPSIIHHFIHHRSKYHQSIIHSPSICCYIIQPLTVSFIIPSILSNIIHPSIINPYIIYPSPEFNLSAGIANGWMWLVQLC